jgi:hypothetical protein
MRCIASSRGNGTFDLGVDVYVPPYPGPGTGYTTSMIGTPIVLSEGSPHDTLSPGNYFEADLTGGGGGASEYEATITGCIDAIKNINPGSSCSGDTDPGCVNMLNGRHPNANIDGIQALIAADSGAYLNAQSQVVNSCAPNCAGYEGQAMSPRVVPVALFSPIAYAAYVGGNGNITLPIVNIMAFFIQSVVSNGKNKGQINGVLVADPGVIVAGGGTVGPNASFLKVTRLVQ